MVKSKILDITSEHIDFVTVSRPASGSNGNNIAFVFHATAAAANAIGKQLPRSITVSVNANNVEALDVTGAGTYVVYGHSRNDPPNYPVFLRNSKTSTHPNVEISVTGGCKTIECPPGCKSFIFGSPCVICIKCDVDIKF